MHVRADRLLVENILGLLHRRGYRQKALSRWCGKTETWLSQILAMKRRVLIDDLDRIADFFGYTTYQLFQPGIASATDRRRGERRSGQDRRIRTAPGVTADTEPVMAGLPLERRRRITRRDPPAEPVGQAHGSRRDRTTPADAERIQAFLATMDAKIDALGDEPVAPRRRPTAGTHPPETARRPAPARRPRKPAP